MINRNINQKSGFLKRLTASFILIAFLASIVIPVPLARAQGVPASPLGVLNLPAVGSMVTMSPDFVPPFIKGMVIHPENPFLLDFVVDPGHSSLSPDDLKSESNKLIKYFLSALTIPEEELWVNLSPYEKDSMISEQLGITEMGRDMLAQDYLLKQLTASLIYPEEEIGKKFWDKIYKKAFDLYGTTEIPINTFHKVWVVPNKAVVYEEGNTVIIIESNLRVMTEKDYVAMSRNKLVADDEVSSVSSEVIRDLIIPEIEKEINEGKNFALLRQIYQSMILATWYKEKLKNSLLNQVYSDQKKTLGIEVVDKEIKQVIYERYLEALKQGVFDYIKEDYDQNLDEAVPRKYFSGGALMDTSAVLDSVGPDTHELSEAESAPTTDNGFVLNSVEFKNVSVKKLDLLTKFVRRFALRNTNKLNKGSGDVKIFEFMSEKLVEDGFAERISAQDISGDIPTDDIKDDLNNINVIVIDSSRRSDLDAVRSKFVKNIKDGIVPAVNFIKTEEDGSEVGVVVLFKQESSNKLLLEHEIRELATLLNTLKDKRSWVDAHNQTVHFMKENGREFGDVISPEQAVRYAAGTGGIGAGLSITNDEPSKAQQEFLSKVIEPVLRGIPDGVEIKFGKNDTGDDFITIEHQAVEPSSGKTVTFSYGIEITSETDGLVITPEVMSLDQMNVMKVPAPSEEGVWEAKSIEEMEYGFRRLIIADPFNPRFSGKIELDKFQRDAVNAVKGEMKKGSKAFAVMATATGKTLVAFYSVKEYLEELPAGSPDLDGAVLFVVNNKIILSETEEKLHNLFPSRFSSSRIYAGEEDMSGDFIFATPTSLASGGRLDTLLRTRRISTVIFDEVHHTPAPVLKGIYHRIEEEHRRKGWNTKYLGFTATETRPDRVSVIKLFEKNIVYEYSVNDGRRQGSLVPMVYLNGDDDINPDNVGPILPGDLLYDKYIAERYADHRFEHLFNQYLANSEKLLDKRGLILAPNVERSQRLAAYFRSEGVAAVSLTATDREDNPVLFEHSYYAWRNGVWPDDSPYRIKPVPKVVVAVNIFKEGIDVPAINLVMLWASTDSTISFMQSIGRGLRVAPFKTHLVVVDAVGLFRKLHLLRFLGGVVAKDTRPPIIGDHPGTVRMGVLDRQKSSKEEGTSPLITSEDVSKVIERFLKDVPGKLEVRYGGFSEIPTKEILETLDPWLAREAGFLDEKVASKEGIKTGVNAFYSFLSEFADKLLFEDVTKQQKLEFRNRFIRAFFAVLVVLKDEDLSETPIMTHLGSVVIIYSRLFELLTRDRAEHVEVLTAHIHDIFPEFDPKRKVMLKNRAKNLKYMRTAVFNRSVLEMMEEIYTQVTHNREVDFFRKQGLDKSSDDKETEFLREFIIAVDYSVEVPASTLSENATLVFGFAEGSLTLIKEHERRTGERILEERGGFDVSEDDQTTLTTVYLSHPAISQTSLSRKDFDLEPPEFSKRLQNLGLTTEAITLRTFINRMKNSIRVYQEAAFSDNKETLVERRNELFELISQIRHQELIAPFTITKAIADRLLSFYDRVKEVQDEIGSDLTERDGEILTIMERMLLNGGVRWSEDAPGVGTVVIRKIDDYMNSFLMNITNLDDRYKDLKETFPLNIFTKSGPSGRLHVLISDRTNALSSLYPLLDADGKVELINAVVEAVTHFGLMIGDDAVFVFPQDIDDNSFYSDFFHLFLETTDHHVLGQLVNINTSSDWGTLDFSFEDTKESRLPFLTAQERVQLAIMRRRGELVGVRTLLHYIYRAIYDYRKIILPFWQRLDPRIESFTTDNTIASKAREHIRDILDMQINKKVTGPKRMAVLKNLFRHIDDLEDVPLTDSQILFMDLTIITGFNFYVEHHWKVRNRIGVTLGLFMALSRYAKARKVEIDSTLIDKVGYFVEDALEQYQDTNDFEEDMLGRADRLDKEIDAVYEKIKETQPEQKKVKITLPQNLKPPFFVKDEMMDDWEVAFWVLRPKPPKRKTFKPRQKVKPTVYWNKFIAERIAATKPKMELVCMSQTGLDMEYGKGSGVGYKLGKEDGTPPYMVWPVEATKFKKQLREDREQAELRIVDADGNFVNFDKKDEPEDKDDVDPGGIDFSAEWLEIESRGQGVNIPLPANTDDFSNINIDGLTPFIYNVTPLPNINILLNSNPNISF